MQISNYSTSEILSEWQAKLMLSQDIKQHIKNGVILSISGEDGGTWLFQPFQLSRVNSKIEDIECTIFLDTATLANIYTGEITPQEAYLAGKLKIVGNESIALYFSTLMLKDA